MGYENYNLLCDEFYLDMYVNTELELPAGRDTILNFFERMQKQFPTMLNFYRRDDNYYLEEDNSSGEYRWLSLEKSRIGSGVVNPSSAEYAYSQDRLVLELMPYMLGVNHLDVVSMDVTFGMDFDYKGNGDEVIAEALLGSSAFGSLFDLPGSRPIDLTPSVVVSLSEDGRTQARVSVDSRASLYDNSDRDRSEDKTISLYFTVRQYRYADRKFDVQKSFEAQCRLAEELMGEKIVPYFVRPLTNIIAQKRII